MLKEDVIKLSQSGLTLPRKGRKTKVVRIVPRYGFYVIEVVYERAIPKEVSDNKRYALVDVGVNNLMAVTFNTGNQPVLVEGKPLKSINFVYLFYNGIYN